MGLWILDSMHIRAENKEAELDVGWGYKSASKLRSSFTSCYGRQYGYWVSAA